MARLRGGGGGLSISPPQLPGGGTPHTHPISDIVDLQMSLNARAMQTSLDATNAQVALKAPLVHGHIIADVSGLQAALDGKASAGHVHAVADITGLVGALAAKSDVGHAHVISDVSGLQTALDGKSATSHGHSNFSTSGAGFVPAPTAGDVTALRVLQADGSWVDQTGGGGGPHTHPISDIVGLQTALDGKSAVGHAHAIADVTGLQTALDGKAASSHTHAQSEITNLVSDLAGKAAASHTHTIANVTGLQTALDGKAASSHTHAIADVTGLQTALDGKAAASHTHAQSEVTNLVSDLAGKAASVHSHAIADVTGLQTALDGKAAASHSHAIADVTGLQTTLDGKAATGHTHSNFAENSAGFVPGPNNTAVTNGYVLLADGTWGQRAALSHSHAIADVTGLQTALDGKAASSHTHAIADVTGLQAALDGKAATSHTHAIADVTGLQTALDGKAASSHTHAIADVTGLQIALDGKAATSHGHSNFSTSGAGFVPAPTAGDVTALRVLQADGSWVDPPTAGPHTHVIADVTGLQTALDGKAAVSHTHAIADVTGLTAALAGKSDTGHSHSNFSTTGAGFVPAPTAGDVSANRLLRADGAWADPPSGGGTPHTLLTPFSAELPTSNFPQLTRVNLRPVLSFSQTTQQSAAWTNVAPPGAWTTLTAYIFFFVAATSGGVRWDITFEAISDGDTVDLDAAASYDAVNSVSLTPVPATAGHMRVSSVVLANRDAVAAGDYIRLNLARVVAHADDTAAGLAHVLMVQLRWT